MEEFDASKDFSAASKCSTPLGQTVLHQEEKPAGLNQSIETVKFMQRSLEIDTSSIRKDRWRDSNGIKVEEQPQCLWLLPTSVAHEYYQLMSKGRSASNLGSCRLFNQKDGGAKLKTILKWDTNQLPKVQPKTAPEVAVEAQESAREVDQVKPRPARKTVLKEKG